MSRSDNVGKFKRSGDRPLRDFELLPARVRRAFADAPYDFAFADVLAQFRLRERQLDRALNEEEIDFALAAMAKEAKVQVEVSLTRSTANTIRKPASSAAQRATAATST